MPTVLILILFCVLSSCRDEKAPDWLLPGFTPGGTRFYPHAAKKVSDNPMFHLHWPEPSREYEYCLVGDIHDQPGIEILADSAKSCLILFGSQGEVLWRKSYSYSSVKDLVAFGEGKRSVVSISGSCMYGIEESDRDKIDLLLWNVAVTEPMGLKEYDAYEETSKGMSINLFCHDFFLSGAGDTVYQGHDLREGLARYRVRYGSDIDKDGGLDYLLRAFFGFSASDRLSQVIKRGVLTKSERAILPTKGGTYLGTKRRIGVYSPDKGGLQWSREIPIDPDFRAICDFYGDDKEEILVSGYALHNEVTLSNGTDKGMGYVYAFTSDGSLLWEYPMHGHFIRSFACVADVFGDDKKEALVVCTSFYGDWGHAAVLNAQTGEPIFKRDTDFSFLGLTAFDEDRDGKSEWYTGSTRGYVYRFHYDRSGELIADSVSVSEPDSIFTYPNVYVIASNDIDGDGSIEVLCVVSRLCHEDFKPLWTGLKYDRPELVVISHKLMVESRYLMDRDAWWGSGLGNNGTPLGYVVDIENDGINEFVLDCLNQRLIFFSYY